MWSATPSGSSIAPSASDSESGSGYRCVSGHARELAQGAVGRAVAREPDVGTEIGVALAAPLAGPARNRGIDRDSRRAARSRLDDSGELVAEDQRAVQPGVADPALTEPVQVRPAQTDGRHSDEALTRSRHGPFLVVQPDVPRSVKARDPHRRRREPLGAALAPADREAMPRRRGCRPQFAHPSVIRVRSRRTPSPPRIAARAASMRLKNSGWFSSRYSNQSSSAPKPIRTPAGRPCRVITISSLAASLRYRERSSLTFARAIRRGRCTCVREPALRFTLRDDREDFDVCFSNVIEHPDLVNPEPVLRPFQASQPLDSAATELVGLMAQVLLDCFPNSGADASGKCSEFSPQSGPG